MSLQMLKHVSKPVGLTIVCVFFAALAAWGQSPLAGEKSPHTQQPASSSGHQVVVLLDINPPSKKATGQPVSSPTTRCDIRTRRTFRPENSIRSELRAHLKNPFRKLPSEIDEPPILADALWIPSIEIVFLYY